jgi:hypothetical protein
MDHGHDGREGRTRGHLSNKKSYNPFQDISSSSSDSDEAGMHVFLFLECRYTKNLPKRKVL